MSRSILVALSLAAGLALAGAPLQAQQQSSNIFVNRGEMELTPYAGYVFTSHFANGPLTSSLGTANGAIYGAQLALPLSPQASLVGGIGYSSADLRAQAFGFGATVGTSVSWIYEGDLQLRATPQTKGTMMGFAPLIQVGAGAIHRNVSAMGFSATATDFAINGGVGVDFVISPGLALRLMAKDYVGKATFDSGLAQTGTLNNVALDAGVRFSF